MLYRILRDNLPTHAQMHVLRLVHTTCTVHVRAFGDIITTRAPYAGLLRLGS